MATLLAVASYGSGSVSLIRLGERNGLPLGRIYPRKAAGCVSFPA